YRVQVVWRDFMKVEVLCLRFGMLQFVDGFVILVRAELVQAPIFIHAGMQEILVDRDQLVAKDLVEVLNDLLVAFHSSPPGKMERSGSLASGPASVKPKSLIAKRNTLITVSVALRGQFVRP